MLCVRLFLDTTGATLSIASVVVKGFGASGWTQLSVDCSLGGSEFVFGLSQHESIA